MFIRFPQPTWPTKNYGFPNRGAFIDANDILEIVDQIRQGTIADDCESELLEIKPFPLGQSTGFPRPDKRRLAGLLREYSVCFANSKGGTLLFGIKDNVHGSNAIQGCAGYDIDEMKRMVFDGTDPPLTVDILEITVFEMVETEPAQSLSFRKPLLATIDRIWEIIQPFNSVQIIKDGLFEIPIPSFPEEVVREGLFNAVIHRSYVDTEAISVRLYKDRLEIGSPGGFIGGITPENILTHEPNLRGQSKSSL